jgi:hypothetical protein
LVSVQLPNLDAALRTWQPGIAKPAKTEATRESPMSLKGNYGK